MFIGAINQHLRAVIAGLSKEWRGIPAVVGCSGNFTIERILANQGLASLHSNDVSLYSCAIGSYLAGNPISVTVEEPSLDWLQPYLSTGSRQRLEPGISTIATLLLCTEWFQSWGRPEPYHRRMSRAYETRWDTLHKQTVQRVRKALEGPSSGSEHHLRIASFWPGDVVDFMEQAPDEAVAIAFPPTYCLDPEERIATADLRWVPCGELRRGDKILAFNEYPQLGHRIRRWQFATITRSKPAVKECVRVHLEDGTSVTCSTDHPWLIDDREGGGARRRWVPANQLVEDKTPSYALRFLNTWEPEHTYDAGWLAGIMDGEGTLNLSQGSSGGTLSLSVSQKPGPVASHLESLLAKRGFSQSPSSNYGGVYNYYINGGLSGIVKALGVLRPQRLLAKFTGLHVSRLGTRAWGNPRVHVIGVENIGLHPVQSISTSSRTYIGEGFAMHNSAGYERMYRVIDRVFAWDAPDYQVFDEERFERLVAAMQRKAHWVVSTDKAPDDLSTGSRQRLAGYHLATVQTTNRARPVYVYGNANQRKLATPHQKVEPVPWPRLEGETEGPLTVTRLSIPQFNALRSEYLSPSIVPANPSIALAVLCDGHIAGALAFSRSQYPGGWADVYMMTDFAVRPTVYPRLSKLVLAASLSHEVRAILEQAFNTRIDTIGTTAFTDKPVSMKYRGVYDLHSRKEARPERDEGGKLNYAGKAGTWSLEEAFAWWLKRHASASAA